MAGRTLIVVTGAPCAGKTTLAELLGRELSLPVIHRDALKETLFDTLGSGNRGWSRTLGGASYDLLFSVLETLLRAGCPCIAESNFEAGRAANRLRGLYETCSFTPIEILCTADLETLRERYRARLASRHVGHVDHLNAATNEASLTGERHGSPDLGGQSVRVDTTRFGETERAILVSALQKVISSGTVEENP